MDFLLRLAKMSDASRNSPKDSSPSRPRLPRARNRYEVPSNSAKELGLWVHAAGFSRVQQPHGRAWERVLGNYAAVYVSRGSGWFQSPPTGRLAVPAGTFFWLFPTVPHTYSPVTGGNWSEQWVIFNGPVAETFEKQGYMVPSKPMIHVGDDPEIVRLFARLEEVFHKSGPLSVPLASAITHELIVVAHGLATGMLGDDKSRGDPVVAEAVRIIDEEAPRGLEPETLAARLHVGYSTLRRRFKSATGFAVKEYILGVQLKKAKDLLAFTRLPVETIAAETGFNDAFYFSRLFKEREGIPPTAFREHETRESQ